MDDGEPSQLYKTLLLEQEYNPSQAVAVLIQYYRMSEEEANLISREYHFRLGEKRNVNATRTIQRRHG
jgi:ATP-dependent Clp protease adapter protein ClpS